MKKLIFILSIALSALLIYSGCEKNDKEPKLNIANSAPAAITNPANGSTIVLTLADSANPVVVQWSAADYVMSGDAIISTPTYSLQIDFADSSFKNPKELVNTKLLEVETIVYNLNTTLLSMGMAGDSTADFEMRVISEVEEVGYTENISDIIRVTITTFEPPVPPPTNTPTLWIPGDYQGWNPAEAPVIYSYTNDAIYKGYMYMPAGGTYEFKFTSAPDWAHTNFGFGGDVGTLSTDPGAGNLSVEGPGGYAVVVDTLNLTWTHTLQNWGVIGEWLGWSSDIDMIWDADNQQLYVTVENIPPAANQRFKFRANDGWAVNLGAVNPDNGTLVQDGADIPIPDGGTITFILRFTTELPTYEIQMK